MSEIIVRTTSFCLLESDKRLVVLLHLSLESITHPDPDPKGKFVSLKFTPSNDRGLCVYVPSGYITREQLVRGRFFEGLQNYTESKNERDENKIIHGDFICTMDKMDRDGENKTQGLCRSCSNYALSKLIVDNRLENLWGMENPDSPEFTHYNRSFGKHPG